MLKLHALYNEFLKWWFNTFFKNFKMMLKMLSRHKGHYMTKALKNRTNCNVMLNAIQERKRYNGLVIIP